MALGPYVIGQLSDLLGDLRLAMMLGLFANGFAVFFLWLASRDLAVDEQTLRERARAAGEPIDAT
jgi:cyanate permease